MEQRSPEWFKARRGRITASLVGALLDQAPYMTKEQAFRALVRSMHDMPDEFKGNIATEYGNNNEALARNAYEMLTGNKVEDVGFVPLDEWAGASPDGLVVSDMNDTLLEIKCPFGKRKDDPVTFASIHDQPHYYSQVQFQMYCTGRNFCDFFQWSPHGHLLERVEFNSSWASRHIVELLRIWTQAGQVDPEDYRGPVRPVFDTPETGRLVTEYDELTEAIENATARKKEIIDRLQVVTGGKDALVSGRKFTLVKRAGAVSYAKALKAYAPDADLEPFRGKESESWRLA